MKQEDKEILLKDLCARLPYGVKAQAQGWDEEKMEEVYIPLKVYQINTDGYVYFEPNDYDANYCSIDEYTPYLRPMSSMTEEERKELEKITYHTFEYKKGERDIWTKSYHKNYLFDGAGELYGAGEPINMLCSSELCTKLIDWLNMHHFDYRHLIERGLALKAKEGMYKK